MKKAKKPVEEQVNSEAELLKAQLVRAMADYDNLRKRTEEEKKLWIMFASQRVIERLLPILDMFEQALIHTKDQGLAIALGEFKTVLKEEGLVEIAPKVGEDYNHDLMEAIDTLPVSGENKEGTIAEVLSVGWKFNGGAVVRHAKVKVYKNTLDN